MFSNDVLESFVLKKIVSTGNGLVKVQILLNK